MAGPARSISQLVKTNGCRSILVDTLALGIIYPVCLLHANEVLDVMKC